MAAFERTWYRANAEIRRARKQAEDAAGRSFENYLDRLCAMPTLPPPSQLASFPHPANVDPPDAPVALTLARDWPPTDEKTGKPLYLVG